MAENKKSVLLYCDIIYTVKELSDDEAGKLFKHYLMYVNDLNPVAPDKLTQLLFEPIKQTLKRDLCKWAIVKSDRSNAGRLGNLKKWHSDLYDKVISCEIDLSQAEIIAKGRKVSQSIAKIAVNVNDNVNVNVNVNEINNSWDSIKNYFFNDFNWIEKFSRDKNVRPDELKRQMKLFIIDIDLSNDIKTLKELQSHFLHSFNKNKYLKIKDNPADKEADKLIAKLRADKLNKI